MTYKGKRTLQCYVGLRDLGFLGWYAIYIDGRLYKQSADRGFIERLYDSLN